MNADINSTVSRFDQSFLQDGQTLAHLAAHNGDSEILTALIQAKADLNLASMVLFAK